MFLRWKILILGALMLNALVGFVYASAHLATPNASASSSSVPILLYHHIDKVPATASRATRRWSLAPKKFEEEMNWIAARGFHTVTMNQLISYLKHGEALPAKPIVLTFDDGWKDQYSVAFPILKQRNFVATFFIITDSVGHSAYMNWAQIQEMSTAGMDIQSHSVTHPRLSILSYEKARYEIVESKKTLESRLNKPVNILAYPFGSYDDDVIKITKAAGYDGAATVSGLNGGYFFRADQSYTLTRYAIEGNDNLASIARWKHFDSN